MGREANPFAFLGQFSESLLRLDEWSSGKSLFSAANQSSVGSGVVLATMSSAEVTRSSKQSEMDFMTPDPGEIRNCQGYDSSAWIARRQSRRALSDFEVVTRSGMVTQTVIELNRGAVDIVERLFSWSNARNR